MSGGLSERLPQRLLLDGGMGTALMARGLEVGKVPTESWNLRHPERVFDVHKNFFDAGAQAAHTNTFGANRLQLDQYGHGHRVEDYNRIGVALAREAGPSSALIIGCMGPTGLLPPPEGNANLCAMEDAFAEQAYHLNAEGVDFIHLESMVHPKEARAALRGVRAGAKGVPVAISMNCRLIRGSYMTPLGCSPELMLQVFAEEKADGVGINCTLAPMDLIALVRMLVDRSDVPVFAQPTIAPSDGAPLYPREFAFGVETLFNVGARAVGGCCGTRPTDISAAYEATARMTMAQPSV